MEKSENIFQERISTANDPTSDLRLSNGQKLKVYALNKQTTEVDVSRKNLAI